MSYLSYSYLSTISFVTTIIFLVYGVWSNFDLFEIIYTISIIALLPYFINKLIEVSTGQNIVQEMCRDIPRYLVDGKPSDSWGSTGESTRTNPTYKECEKEQRRLTESSNHTRFLALIVTGAVLVVSSSYIATYIGGKQGQLIGTSVIISGLVLLLSSLGYWNTVGEYGKLAITGLSLFFIMYFGFSYTQFFSLKGSTSIAPTNPLRALDY